MLELRGESGKSTRIVKPTFTPVVSGYFAAISTGWPDSSFRCVSWKSALIFSHPLRMPIFSSHSARRASIWAWITSGETLPASFGSTPTGTGSIPAFASVNSSVVPSAEHLA